MWCRTVGVMVPLALSILVASLVADAQPAGKVYRIGRLAPGFPEGSPFIEGFRQALHERGYIEGQNLVIEYRWAEGRDERLPDLAAELVRLPVDVLVPLGGNIAIRAAQQATRTIPIVMVAASDPVAQGFVASLARPGGNITGLSVVGPELLGKQLEILKETVPQSTRVAVLANPGRRANPERDDDKRPDQSRPGAVAASAGRGGTPCGGAGRRLCRDDPHRRGRALRVGGAAAAGWAARTDCGPGRHAPAAGDVHLENVCGRWGPDVLWGEPSGAIPAHRQLCGQDPQRRHAR
jgi:hypothetical protein